MTSKVLVVGSGAIGLRTALELLKRNIPIVLKSAHPPNHISTCSMGAGGLWMPYKCDDPRVSGKWALETLNELLSYTTHKNNDETSTDRPLVEIVPTVYLTTTHQGPNMDDFVKSDFTTHDPTTNTKTTTDENVVTPLPKWTKDPRIKFQHLTVEMLWWQNEVFKLRLPSLDTLVEAGYLHALLFHPPIVDSPRMLKKMLSEIEAHNLTQDINVDMTNPYESIEEMVEDAKELGCDTVINCTGYGAKTLCNDTSEMVGGRGVLIQYDRSTCERKFVNEKDDDDSNSSMSVYTNDAAITIEDGPWGTQTEPCYLIPRGNTLVVGGTYLEGDTKEGLRDEERSRLLKNAAKLGINTAKSDVMGEWTGFRPCRRPTVRLEVDEEFSGDDDDDTVKVVHSYGHGGSGWTTFVGVAKDTADLLGK